MPGEAEARQELYQRQPEGKLPVADGFCEAEVTARAIATATGRDGEDGTAAKNAHGRRAKKEIEVR